MARSYAENERSLLKMKIGRYLNGVVIAVLLAAIPAAGAWATYRSEAERAIAAAKQAQEKAAAAGVASGQTEQMIKEAEGLLPSRQYTKARQLAKEAQKLSESAVEEAKAAPPPSKPAQPSPAPKANPTATAGENNAAPAAAPAAGSAEEAQKSIAAAELARQRAASVGGEWRDTGKMIKDATLAAKAGDYAEAVRLADKAKHQGDLGYEQAIREKNADFPPYMK
jgi:hypothetical protein